MLTATANHSALNIGNALGAYSGGLAITLFGLHSLTWLAAALAALGLIGIGFSRSLDRSIKQKAMMRK